ncbi:hypothetical protein FSST1_007557 [Fusarium sambucinum]
MIYHITIYIKQSVNFQKRREAHQRHAVNGERSTHYTLAAKANQVRMVPIIIQDTQNVPDGFLDIAEFTVVALLGSWYATLRRPLEPNAFGSYSVDHEACQMFSRIMTVVSNRTGWNRGLTYGLNWNTPIVRHPKFDMKWTSWYDEASDCLVYRTRRTIHQKLVVEMVQPTVIPWPVDNTMQDFSHHSLRMTILSRLLSRKLSLPVIQWNHACNGYHCIFAKSDMISQLVPLGLQWHPQRYKLLRCALDSRDSIYHCVGKLGRLRIAGTLLDNARGNHG